MSASESRSGSENEVDDRAVSDTPTSALGQLASVQLPVKRYYRQRAHCNPWSDHTLDYPIRPEDMHWGSLFNSTDSVGHLKIDYDRGDEEKNMQADQLVRFVDVGCGYGGLLFQLACLYPDIRSVGLEIRLKVSDFVQQKIHALRINHPGQYNNIACLRTNAMRFLPNYFHKGQLRKLFFLYPDPHFKRVKHKWRIISPTLLDVYAHLLAVGGRLYTATDVPALAQWMSDCLSNHLLFRPVVCCELLPPGSPGGALRLAPSCSLTVRGCDPVVSVAGELDRLLAVDPVLRLLTEGTTEESHKACREGRGTSVAVFERVPNPTCSSP